MNLKQFQCVQCNDTVVLDMDLFPKVLPEHFAVLCTPCLERGMEEGRQLYAPD